MTKRCFGMLRVTAFASAMLALSLAGCHRHEKKYYTGANPSGPSTGSSSASLSSPAPAGEVENKSALPLDTAALQEREDPTRLLRFYAAALHARDWTAAAKAWGQGSGVTASTLKQSYDRTDPPTLEIGKGDEEGAAGSVFYEAPVTLHFGAGAPPERGSLVLRRVNNVDGATAEQLRWHIERSTIGQGD